LILGWVCIGIGALLLINPIFVGLWVGDQFYLGIITSVLFGTFILVDMAILPHRIILTSSLYRVREQAYFTFLQALIRIGIIFLILNQFQTNAMPASLLLS